MVDVLDRFSSSTREWFSGAFPAPTPAQLGAWEAISTGEHALVVAPTGSGKTLAAFLWSIDRLLAEPTAPELKSSTILYVSPLKALAVDVERNLRAPLVGVTQTARRHGLTVREVRVGIRSGDTPAGERRTLASHPPDILITTPESLYLMLTSAARESLRGVQTVIIDEVHAVASTKRGAHLALSLERLDALLEKPAQRIGLSATVRPVEEVARFLGGSAPVSVVSPASTKTFDLSVVVPVEDMSDLGSTPLREGSTSGGDSHGSIWPHVEESIVEAVLAHTSSIVFTNSRRHAERITARLNEIYVERLAEHTAQGDSAHLPVLSGSRVDVPAKGTAPLTGAPAQLMGQSGQTSGAAPLLARAHHGSVSKEQRAFIEDDLKAGRLRCVVATSSLELGIDMGAVDLVIQVEAPPSVSSGLQRLGRAGHQVGEVSRGLIYPKHRADLLHSAVVSARMTGGRIEAMAIPQNPLDILAQQTIAACALDILDVEEWFDTVRRSAPFQNIPRSAYDAVLDLVSGLYPSDEFADLRPRIVWDRDAGTLTGRPGAQRLAVTSGGTIPDRGMFGVFMVGETNARVGELDEEMVYESRVGDVFALGATSWRIAEITFDRVLVTPAFGEPGRVPFWHGDGIGRPAELGRAIGEFTRKLDHSADREAAELAHASGLDTRAARNLIAFVREQREATGQVPTDQTLVIERFRDELGDWRVVLHSPFGMKVHAPWALAVGGRVRERHSVDGGVIASDDGIVVRLPDTDGEPPTAELFLFDPGELERIVTDEVGGSSLFASRFRENAARALLLPRQNPARRSPLWQQRQRSAQLLEVARKHPTFPIILETVRECLQDVYDLPGLVAVAREIEARSIRIVETETSEPSPFARSLLFGYVAAFVYEGDSPLAERRAAALSLDPTLLSELLGRAELRELLDPAVIETTELQLQRLTDDRKARGAEGVVDLIRGLGPLTPDELSQRLVDSADLDEWLRDLERTKRVLPATIAGERRWAAIEDASRLRDALGVPLPIGVPDAFIHPAADPLGDLVSRYARTHGPFTAPEVAARYGLGAAVVGSALLSLSREHRVVEGEFRPTVSAFDRVGAASEWCDTEVLRRLRSRSLAALRQEVEPVEQAAFARFLPAWQHIGGTLRGVDGVLTVVEQLAGVPIPASAWETLILPSRVRDYTPALLDELTSSGEVLWSGGGSLPGADGWVCLHLSDALELTLPDTGLTEPSALARSIQRLMRQGGGYFFRDIAGMARSASEEGSDPVTDGRIADALWELAWAGRVTNDTFAPLRALTGAGTSAHRAPRRAPRPRAYRGRSLPRSSMPPPSPTTAGRWSLLPDPETDPTVRGTAAAEFLLGRYGIVTRGSVVSERLPGGFAFAYRVLTGYEETGRARRGYFIEGLGAAQFSTGATVDRLRAFTRDSMTGTGAQAAGGDALVLAATDPANPFGAALPWPETEGHRPGRKAGGLVVIVDGALAGYLERGGKTMLTFTSDQPTIDMMGRALREAVAEGRVTRLTIEKIDGEFSVGSAIGTRFVAAGFAETPKGLRIRRA